MAIMSQEVGLKVPAINRQNIIQNIFLWIFETEKNQKSYLGEIRYSQN